MTNRNRLLYALVLLPTLLLTSCYKDFDKVRVKPFKPDLVVPLATADNITFADMLVKGDDTIELDRSYDDKRIGLRYNLKAQANISVSLKSDCEVLVFAGNDQMVESVLNVSRGNVEKIIQLTFKEGAVLTAGKDVELPLAEGAGFLELQGNKEVTLQEGKVVDFSQIDENSHKKTTIKVSGAGIESVRVKLGNIPTQRTGDETAVPIKVYRGLLWYSGKLTDPRVVLHVGRNGWVRRAKVNYWFDNFYLETKKGEKQAIVGEGKDALPFNKVGESGNKGTLEASVEDTVVTPPYLVNTSNLEVLSKEWPLTIYTGSAFCKPAEDEVTIYAGEKANNFGTRVEFKLPFTGRFNALVREFKAEDKGGIELPDVNELLQDSGSKGGVKSRFTKNDTVLLHFYFKNATPMDIYLAAKIGKMDAASKEDKTALRASEIEGLSSDIDSEKLEEKVGSLTIGDFKFFKAVEGADAGGEYGTAMGSKSKVVTIPIPYSEYEKAQKDTVNKRQVRALLLFRSPNGTDGQPIVVSPRLNDFVSIRLGVEVKPEVSIELMNKK